MQLKFSALTSVYYYNLPSTRPCFQCPTAAERHLAAVEDKRRDALRRTQELQEQQRQQQLVLGAGGTMASLGPVTGDTAGDSGVQAGELSKERLEAARREAEEDERAIERAREALRRAQMEQQAARMRADELETRRRQGEWW